MRIDVFTIFPAILEAPVRESLLGRAIAEKLLEVRIHDLRTWSTDRHRSVDDEAYGGGPGMVLKPEPIFAAVESLDPDRGRVLLLSPAGRRLEQSLVRELAGEEHLTLVCGRYEGVDERVVEGLPAEELSIGDYVLAGEVPALVVIEAVTRLIPGVIGKEASHERDSFAEPGMLDHPHFTRPAEFRGWSSPRSCDRATTEPWNVGAGRPHARKPFATAPTWG